MASMTISDSCQAASLETSNWEKIVSKMFIKDKIALLFLIGEDLQHCWNAIANVLQNSCAFLNYITDINFSGSSNLIEHEMKLSDALYTLKQYLPLTYLGGCRHTYRLHGKLDKFRVFLFTIIDDLSCNEADLICSLFCSRSLGNDEGKLENMELLFLKLIQTGRISLQEMSVLESALQKIFRRDLSKRVNDEVKSNRNTMIQKKMEAPVAEDCYKMDKFPTGFCIIFNQKHFWREPNEYFSNVISPGKLEDRIGTDIDRDYLSETFKIFGFQIKVFENRTHLEILQDLDDVSREQTDCNCLVVCILSHGTQGQVMGCNSVPVSMNDIKMKFRGTVCPWLIGKPKIFIIQACQGSVKQAPAIPGESISDVRHDGPQILTVPEYHDVYEMYSTVQGYLSFRNTVSGSWFISTLCYYLKENGHAVDIERVATRVNCWVASAEAYEGGEVKKQMPQFTSCLRKRLRFKRSLEGLVDAIIDRLEREFLGCLIDYFVAADYGAMETNLAILTRQSELAS